MIKDKTTIKAEYKPGGKNRQYVLDKAVKFLTAKLPISFDLLIEICSSLTLTFQPHF